MVQRGSFREDLWYRISVFPIRLPPLRERLEDVPALAAHFARRAGTRLGGMALPLSSDDIRMLVSYDWPGNVRELAAVIERAAILGGGRKLELATALGIVRRSSSQTSAPVLPAAPLAASSGRAQAIDQMPVEASLDSATAKHIEAALERSHGRIDGPFGAARALNINPHTLRARMRKLGIDWRRFKNGV
jgi:hydrogenase-4 transcriptional activator